MCSVCKLVSRHFQRIMQANACPYLLLALILACRFTGPACVAPETIAAMLA